MENKEKVLFFLKDISLFKNAGLEAIKKMASNLQEKRLFKDEIMFLQGDRVDEIFIVKEGSIEISRMSEDGKKLTLKILEKGEVFCLENVFINEAIHNCRAKEDSIFYSISSKIFKKLCDENTYLSESITESLVRNIIYYSTVIDRVKLMDGKSCISSLLVEMQKNRIVYATQEELADISGLCRETVSRLLKEIKEEGCIETKKGSIAINNLQTLKKMCS